METIDFTLGLLESALIVASVATLIAASRRRGRRLLVAALVLPAVTAVTVAHPFGVVAIERDGPASTAAAPVDPAEMHRFSTLGVPGLTKFKVYTRDIVYIAGEGGYPSDTLRVRSWIGPGLFTNSSEIAAMCGTTDQPCWRPEPYNPGDTLVLRGPYGNGTWELDILRDVGAVFSERATRSWSWALIPGVTSWAGAVFWLGTGLMWWLIFRSRGAGCDSPAARKGRARDTGPDEVKRPRLAALVLIPLPLAVLSGVVPFLGWPSRLAEGELGSGQALATALSVAFYALAPAATMVLCSIRAVPPRRTLGLAVASGLAVPGYQVAALAALFAWLVHQTAF